MELSDNLVFTGCSIVAGNGWNSDNLGAEFKEAENLWVNKCHKNIDKFKDLNLINLSNAGTTNAEIFEEACHAIGEYSPRVLVCCWTAIRRVKLYAGFELYDTLIQTHTTSESFWRRYVNKTFGTNTKTYKMSTLKKLIDQFRSLQHPHYEIATLTRYTRIIDNLCEATGTQVYHINVLCPWDDNFFNKKENVLPSEYTKYTQKILSSETRDDEQVFALYDTMHNDYANAGGVSPNWVNLYQSLKSMQIDFAYDNSHPGIKSGELYLKLIKEYVDNE
jgi:hypothetical protein